MVVICIYIYICIGLNVPKLKVCICPVKSPMSLVLV